MCEECEWRRVPYGSYLHTYTPATHRTPKPLRAVGGSPLQGVYGVLLSNLGGFALQYMYSLVSDMYSLVSDMYPTCIRCIRSDTERIRYEYVGYDLYSTTHGNTFS